MKATAPCTADPRKKCQRFKEITRNRSRALEETILTGVLLSSPNTCTFLQLFFFVLKGSIIGKCNGTPLRMMFMLRGAPHQRLPEVVMLPLSIPVPAESISILWRFLQILGHEY